MVYNCKKGETPLEDLSGLKIKIPNITRAQLDEEEAKNIQRALKKHIKRKSYRFEWTFFDRLHADMFSDVWKWAGVHRTEVTNIGSRPELILQELIIMQKDLEMRPNDMETGIWLHHRAVQIHPYRNGNGRWARMLSDLWLRQNTGIKIRWPVGLNNESPIRHAYLDALRAADRLDYGPLNALYKNLI